MNRASFIRRALLGVLAAPFAARTVCQPKPPSPTFTNLPGFPHQPVLPLRGFARDVCMLDEHSYSIPSRGGYDQYRGLLVEVPKGYKPPPDITHYRLYRRA